MTTQPSSMAELAALTTANTRYSGHGMATAMHFPCPFCAAADCLEAKIVEVEGALRKGGTCKACGRAWRAIVTEPAPGSKNIELVQCGGDDPPDWFQPRMRRVEPLAEVYSRPECVFHYCPSEAACRAADRCQNG